MSLLKVVATIDSPASHHGTARPEAKNSDVLLPARRPKNSAGAKQMTRQTNAMSQSMACRCMGRDSTTGWTRTGWRRGVDGDQSGGVRRRSGPRQSADGVVG